ncbi:MAG TPA: DUF448 domain-containing protein [Clostridiales bacterium]|nr:DUF448 domain-containing protein [Clostridiales bacterium]
MLKSLPQRSCIGCNIKKDKKDLIRIVKDKDGNISIDKTGKANGRGAYICDNIECLEKAIKSKRLERTFEKSIDSEIYENLRGVIIDK